MSDTITTCLRGLPLSHYLLRGLRSNAAVQYEELRRLQDEQSAITPLSGGPFRLFVAGRKLVSSMNRGLDVFRVEPAANGIGGRIFGLVDRAQLRIVIGHEPESPALADWWILSVEKGRPLGSPLARLKALWSAYKKQVQDVVAGNSTGVLTQFKEVEEEYQTWEGSWQPPTVRSPDIVVRASRRLPCDGRASVLLDGLVRSATPAYFYTQSPTTAGVTSKDTLRLVVPAYKLQIELHRRLLADSAPNEWVLVNLLDQPTAAILFARLDVVWRQPSPKGRGASSQPCENAWLEQADVCESRYRRWLETGWEAREIPGGIFSVRITSKGQDQLQRHRIKLEELCAAMSRGLNLYEVTGKDADVIVAVPDGMECRVRLTPYKPFVGDSDWEIINVREAESALPAFAQVVAKWEQGTPGCPPSMGDSVRLVRELDVLQKQRHEIDQQIGVRIEELAGSPVELSERIACWRKVCEFERDLLEVGVSRLDRRDTDFFLIPEEQETVEEWIDGIETLNKEGVDWTRYPLDLRMGKDRAGLVIRSVEVVVGDVIGLRFSCDNPRGRALVDRVCNGGADDMANQSELRLFLPDSQLNKIDDALDWLDPNPESRTNKRSGVVGDYLAPDDLSLRTLQRILATPNELEVVTPPWPSLPMPPLADLSPKQEEAVRAAIFGPDMTLIQGPPGTGKTTVILEILRQLFRMRGKDAGFKVLLVAPTHVAVDNVLERLVAPRSGSNLVMELGVAPYRVGSTRSIAEHLRGYTPDCLNTEYRESLEREVAQAVAEANRECKRDHEVLKVLADGAVCDAVSWGAALRSGELLDFEPTEWPNMLDDRWNSDVHTPDGRVRAWRHWRARGTQPEKRSNLLQRWLDFLQINPRFFSELLVANANLVCATTIGCATHRELRSVSYDYVIVDEAGKEEARRLLVPLIRGERWVLVGDHQQLPPYADDSLKARLLQEGLDPRTITSIL